MHIKYWKKNIVLNSLPISFIACFVLTTENDFAFASESSGDWLLDLSRCHSLFFYGELGQCCSAAPHLVTKLRDLFIKAVPKQLLCCLFHSLPDSI